MIGPAMADHYRRKFAVDPLVVHRALPGPVEAGPSYNPAVHGLRVGILGSTYAYKPLPILARAVAEAARTLGVPGRIRVIGRSHGERLRNEVGDLVEVEVLGHVDEREGVARLRDCFALYLNYPFGWLDSALRRLSFPTKLGTYALAGRPILIHAPGESSVVSLQEIDGYAGHWSNLDPRIGAEALLKLWSQGFASRHEEAEQVRQRYYDPERNRRALFGALEGLIGASR